MGGEELFAFCIPLIAREKSNDWQMVLDNLQATLQSMLKQFDQNFIVMIASDNDIHLPEIRHPRVLSLRAPKSLDPAGSGTAFLHSDALRKKLFLLDRANSIGVRYVMNCSADDLISSQLVDFVRTHKHPVGYVIRNGFVFDVETGKMLPFPCDLEGLDSFDAFCATSIILTLGSELVGLDLTTRQFFSLNHRDVREQLKSEGRPAFEILHPSVVAVLNSGDNPAVEFANQEGNLESAARILASIEEYGTPMTLPKLQEFGLV